MFHRLALTISMFRTVVDLTPSERERRRESGAAMFRMGSERVGGFTLCLDLMTGIDEHIIAI